MTNIDTSIPGEQTQKHVSFLHSLAQNIRQSFEIMHQQQPGQIPKEKIFHTMFLIIVIAIFLLPFVNVAFHTDDPLFLWSAKAIQQNPFHPCDITVNWYGTDLPMSMVTKNPPLTSYFIAIVSFVVGWSETVLHLVFLGIAAVVGIGMYLIAKKFCQHPLLAALIGICTPVFLFLLSLLCPTCSCLPCGYLLYIAGWKE
jgi:hypothetical protein